MPAAALEIGVIADTHGLLRPEALQALRGVSLIIHAGDVGRADILEALRAIAPVEAVRGNVDTGPFGASLPETLVVAAGAARLYVLHDVKTLEIDPAAEGMAAVISGHSHRQRMEQLGSVLYLNPGCAGPQRFKRAITLARIRVAGKKVTAKFIELLPAG